jgi:hypothetical protein
VKKDLPTCDFVFGRGQQGAGKCGFTTSVRAHDGVNFSSSNGQRKTTQDVIATFGLVGLGAGMKVVYSKQVTHAL